MIDRHISGPATKRGRINLQGAIRLSGSQCKARRESKRNAFPQPTTTNHTTAPINKDINYIEPRLDPDTPHLPSSSSHPSPYTLPPPNNPFTQIHRHHHSEVAALDPRQRQLPKPTDGNQIDLPIFSCLRQTEPTSFGNQAVSLPLHIDSSLHRHPRIQHTTSSTLSPRLERLAPGTA